MYIPLAKVQKELQGAVPNHDSRPTVNAGRAVKVSVGLPVYNGERFLAQTIRSLLRQTLGQIELIICDNASTDATREICLEFAGRDSRIRYYRNERNLGAAPNFRKVFELARAPYFKWAAHDDLCLPELLEKCAGVLDREPSVVLCYPRATVVDEGGRYIRERGCLNLDASDPDQRFRRVLSINIGSPVIFGVIRSAVLRKTGLIGNYYASDQVLNAELALHGRLYELPEALLLHREHGGRSVYAHPNRASASRWFSPNTRKRTLPPAWGVLQEYLSAVKRAPLTIRQRFCCLMHTARWAKAYRSALAQDFWTRLRQVFGLWRAARSRGSHEGQ